MNEEIRKDMIEQLSYFVESNPKGSLPYEDVEELFNSVLDKYKDQSEQLATYKEKEDKQELENKLDRLEKYKNAWEEAKEQMGDGTFPISYNTMQELEQKNGIEVNRDVKTSNREKLV